MQPSTVNVPESVAGQPVVEGKHSLAGKQHQRLLSWAVMLTQMLSFQLQQAMVHISTVCSQLWVDRPQSLLSWSMVAAIVSWFHVHLCIQAWILNESHLAPHSKL